MLRNREFIICLLVLIRAPASAVEYEKCCKGCVGVRCDSRLQSSPVSRQSCTSGCVPLYIILRIETLNPSRLARRVEVWLSSLGGVVFCVAIVVLAFLY